MIGTLKTDKAGGEEKRRGEEGRVFRLVYIVRIRALASCICVVENAQIHDAVVKSGPVILVKRSSISFITTA